LAKGCESICVFELEGAIADLAFLFEKLDESVIKPGTQAIREGTAVESLIDGVSKLGRKVGSIWFARNDSDD